MIKEYYKILGVNEDAPEQEIRARWIELMKHFHPDVQQGMEFDEISKEINEAYQVLKDPFTRADYDHDLAQHRYYRRKRVGHRLGFFLLGSILFIAILYMAISPNKTFIPSVSRPIHRNVAAPQTEKEASRAEVEVKAKDKVKVEKKQPSPSNPINPSNQAKAKVEDKAKVKIDQTNQINEKNQINRTEVKAQGELKENQINQTDQRNPITQVKAEAKVKIDQTNQINEKNQINRTEVKAKVEVKNNQINQTDQTNQINRLNPKNPIIPSNPTTLLVAREGEIKKFFADYVDRYNRRDISGFISFFSNRAIQNQKDGLEEIKKIYSNFFNQSLQIRYRMSDLKVEIYQNGVNVNAQYELDQLARNGRRNAFKGRIRWVLAKEGGGLKIVSLDYQQTKGESHEI